MATELEECFYYFGYGNHLSNIHLHNKNALKVGIGKLVGYELHFGDFPASSSAKNWWKGGLASIQEKPGSVVWGVIWKINQTDLENLDRQVMGYCAKDVTVEKEDGGLISCRVYQLSEYIPAAPSTEYKRMMVDGAVENSLPKDYISKLVAIEDNGQTGAVDAMLVDSEETQKTVTNGDGVHTSKAIHRSEGYFLYFAYGSNINSKRFSISCPSSKKVAVGCLKEFSLEFALKEQTSGEQFVGATIESRLNASTWGVVWRVDLTELPKLDRQECIKEKFYEPVDVSVDLENEESVICRTYRVLPPYSLFPPSVLYKSVIIKGAEEHALPAAYIETLRSLPEGPEYTAGPMKSYYLEATKN